MNPITLIENLKNGTYDKLINDIYVDKSLVEYQKERYTKAIKSFLSYFNADEINIFSAPGRSEVCGNHTDHQHGMVLATAINLDTIAVVEKNNEHKINLISEGYDMVSVNTDDLEVNPQEVGTSSSLIRGVLAGLLKKGYKTGGFNAYVTSDVLVGAGLSSSAAFENIIGVIISGLFNDMSINSIEIAQCSQFAENVYFDKPCGLMDQMACSVGGMINIDFKDPRDPVVKKIDIDFEKHNYSLCIVDTKGSHVDLTGDYASIPEDMKRVANFFDKEYLRECSVQEFYNSLAKLREKVSDRAILRSIHFFREEENVQNAVLLLEKDDFDSFLSIIKRSGDSSFKFLQNIYSNKDTEHQGLSLAIAVSEGLLKSYGVCRVHGGGFAGTIQAFVCNDFVMEYKRALDSVFGKDACHILKVRDKGAIKVV